MSARLKKRDDYLYCKFCQSIDGGSAYSITNNHIAHIMIDRLCLSIVLSGSNNIYLWEWTEFNTWNKIASVQNKKIDYTDLKTIKNIMKLLTAFG